MLPLNEFVLLRRVRIGGRKFDPLFIIEVQHIIRGKLTAIVVPDLLNFFLKLILFHSTEIVNYSKKK